MILAAGLGTRLGALTSDRPKALVELQGKTLLSIVMKRLSEYGFDDVIINVHHFADQIKDYLKKNDNFGMRVTLSDESEQLLDSGGGIKKASSFFDDGQPFLVHNVDIISTIDLGSLYEYHKNSNVLATLACSNRKSSRYFLFDLNNRLCGWKNRKTGEEKITFKSEHLLKQMAFNGIHVIDPKLIGMITQKGTFSIVDAYLQLAPETIIQCFDTGNIAITDAGKPETLARLQHEKIV